MIRYNLRNKVRCVFQRFQKCFAEASVSSGPQLRADRGPETVVWVP